MKHIFLIFLFAVIFFFNYSIAQAIEVGGHLTEDTTWSPENNPYLVTSSIYVEEGVTLTILPGTVVKFNACLLDSYNDDFTFNGGIPLVTYIRCEGNIIAEGTAQDNIIFTRIQNEDFFHWGNIYLPINSGFGYFKYCRIKYAALVGYSIVECPYGAISVRNNNTKIENCIFVDNGLAVEILIDSGNIEIKNNYFGFVDFIHPSIANTYGKEFIYLRPLYEYSIGIPLITSNIFNHGTALSIRYSGSFVNNEINYSPDLWGGIDLSGGDYTNYIYNNTFNNCRPAIMGDTGSLFVKKNLFTAINGNGNAIYVDNCYLEIIENYIEKGNVYTVPATGKIVNNTLNNGELWASGELDIQNNLCYNNPDRYGLKVGYNNRCANNISVNNKYAIWSATETYTNCIFINNEELTEHYVNGYPVFHNCIIDFPLEPPLIDGGGNIIVDSLQAQEIFVDIENGDFHLATNSIAIDAGFDTLGYYYPFDLDNTVRVWDGDGDGNAIIDIGAYEYGAPQLGKISGYITESFSGEPVDYVLLKANNEPGEFTFADSSGYFEIQLPEGTYDLYAERVFYEDNIIYTVTVENEQTTEIQFNMTYNDPLVSVEDNELNINNSKLKTSNYPNPFNPSTTISFNVPSDSYVSVEVYNVKGQKVKTLLTDQLSTGQHELVWNGLNDKNKPVSSGVYLYKVGSGNQETVKRMILLK